ncbi:MAG: SCO family protein [Bacteroidetes bacterium]|jgi:protein SCO1/2|nr:SCO family protein [Bacteroidota bacterium]
MKIKLLILSGLISVWFTGVSFAQLNQNRPPILDKIDVEEKLGDTIPMDLTFAKANGDSVQIGDLLQEGKPVILNPLYYECPILCSVVLDAMFGVLDMMAWTPGEEYVIISFSIDPEEKHPVAAETRNEYLERLNRPSAAEGWHFLTGNEPAIRTLTDAVGFGYTYDEANDQYVHLASVMMLSPEGVVTRYLYGASFDEFNFRNALYESADGKIGSAIDRVILSCFTYDPASNSYVPVALDIMKLGGLATVIILGIFLGVFWRRERGTSEPSNYQIDTLNEQTE